MKKYSKLMSLVLRHQPDVIGITLDKNGWTPVSHLVRAIQKRYPEFTDELLDEVVATNDKRRFEFDVTGERIRACQGHSVEVDLALQPSEPPDVLYHGTSQSNAETIMESGGIKRMNRHAVQLSTDVVTARAVGRRKGGTTMLLPIRAKEMFAAGYSFYRTTNDVWLTDEVPARFIGNTIVDSPFKR